jgi:predicted component of type VI protein secretion system
MLLSEHKDLKLAIRSLPEKEKDKLLLRLVAKDKVLTEHLHFKLLENEQDLSDRCEALMERIDRSIAELLDNRKLTSKDTLAKMRGCRVRSTIILK